MSKAAMGWAERLALPPDEKAVLRELAKLAPAGRDVCWAYRSRLARGCGVSAKTIDRKLKALAAKGLITKRKPERNGSREACTFLLHLRVTVCDPARYVAPVSKDAAMNTRKVHAQRMAEAGEAPIDDRTLPLFAETPDRAAVDGGPHPETANPGQIVAGAGCREAVGLSLGGRQIVAGRGVKLSLEGASICPPSSEVGVVDSKQSNAGPYAEGPANPDAARDSRAMVRQLAQRLGRRGTA